MNILKINENKVKLRLYLSDIHIVQSFLTPHIVDLLRIVLEKLPWNHENDVKIRLFKKNVFHVASLYMLFISTNVINLDQSILVCNKMQEEGSKPYRHSL